MTPSSNFVFLDTGGKRWARLRIAIAIASIAVLVAGIAFIRALYVTPKIHPPTTAADPELALRALQKMDETIHNQPSPPKWLSVSKQNSTTRSIKPGDSAVRLGFFSEWDPNAILSLKRHHQHLTHLAPEWFVFHDSSGEFFGDPDPDVQEFVNSLGLKLIPILSNLDNDTWYPEAVENLAFGSQEKRQNFITKLISLLTKHHAAGVLLDWEQIDPTYKDQMTSLLSDIATGLHQNNLELWLGIPSNSDAQVFDLDSLGNTVDKFVALIFDETGETEAGPIASQQWYTDWLTSFLQHGDPKKWVIGIGNFGYDWPQGGTAQQIGFVDAMSRAYHANHGPIISGAPYYEPHFSYSEAGAMHTVWFLDAITFRNQLVKTEALGVGGIGIFRLGTEDPQVWSLLGDNNQHPRDYFQHLRTNELLSHIGEGEIITFNKEHGDGYREITQGDSDTWIEQYTLYPQYPVIWHEGAISGDMITITFDDGPDPEWTPQILDILKAKNVKATFFLLGSNASSYPYLVKRIVAEGHEVGNHSYTHPNLAEVSSQRITLELNATQRAIEGITGRSTTLFRPPYDADTNPKTLDDCSPLLTAQELGYINVMESVDSEDWQEGTTAEDIVGRVKSRRREGSVLLFHDAGGDRSQTVKALPEAIDWLRARGDRVVSLAELLGTNDASLMPQIPKDESASQKFVAKTGFTVIYVVEEFVWAFMIVATILVVLRTAVIVILAIIHKRLERSELQEKDKEANSEPVSVIIAAYNEAKVIKSTLRSILSSNYKGTMEVVVVDDGSTDNTAEIVETIAQTESRLRLIKQENHGKAYALRNAISNANHEYLIMLDADTQFAPNAIEELVSVLSNPDVGAVSGHAKVGNTKRWLGRFQALEYTCGFNLDRRAYDIWDCITVAPGAVSGYRKSAIEAAGGIPSDTLAEDTDITLQLHRLGYIIRYTSHAVAWTEAPETFTALAKQRTRWAFGTIQCLWKHRDLLFNPIAPGLGFFSLPGLWFFQLFLVAIIPIIDFMLIVSLINGSGGAIAGYAIAFLVIDLILASVACIMEKERLTLALNIIPMRILYRPLLAYAVWCSIIRVMRGAWVGWGKLERKGSVRPRLLRTQESKEKVA